MLDNPDIIKLIAESSSGNNKEAWEKVCAMYYMDLYMEALSVTHKGEFSERCVKKTFDYAYSHFIELQNLKQFDSWIHEILRKQLSLTDKLDQIDTDETMFSSDEREKLITEMLDILTDQEQTVLLMYAYEGNSISFIADKLQISEEKTEELLSCAERKAEKYIRNTGVDQKYRMDAIPLLFAFISSMHHEKTYDPKIKEIVANGIKGNSYKEEIIDKTPEIQISHRKSLLKSISEKRIHLRSKSSTGLSIALKVTIAGAAAVGVATGTFIYKKKNPNRNETVHVSASVAPSQNTSIWKDQKKTVLKKYGTAGDLESTYSYRNNLLSTGNYDGNEGVITTVTTDIDADHEDELLLFWQKKEGSGYGGLNIWNFGFDVYEQKNGKLEKTAEQIIFTINGDHDKEFAVFDEPEVWMLNCCFKNMSYGKEILTDASFSEVDQKPFSITTDKVYGYRYDGNTVTCTGSFKMDESDVRRNSDNVKKMGFSEDEFSIPGQYSAYDGGAGENLLPQTMLIFKLDTKSRSRFIPYTSSENRRYTGDKYTDSELKNYRNVVHEKVYYVNGTENTDLPEYMRYFDNDRIYLASWGNTYNQYGYINAPVSQIEKEKHYYIVKNQPVMEIDKYTDSEKSEEADKEKQWNQETGETPACNFELLPDQKYGCHTDWSSMLSTTVWRGDLRLSSDAKIYFLQTGNQKQISLTVPDFLDQNFSFLPEDQQIYLNTGYLIAVIMQVDEKGYITELGIPDYN